MRGSCNGPSPAGLRVAPADGPVSVRWRQSEPGQNGRSWLIREGRASLAVAPPETSWRSLPTGLDGAIFTGGGPAEWQGPGQGFGVTQVAANSRDGVPARAFLSGLTGAPVYRTDRLGTVELVDAGGGFARSPQRAPANVRSD